MAVMIPESELILNKDGSVYHLNLLPEDIAETIFFVGDPGRVKEVSKHFDEIEVKKEKREFITHTGRIGNRRFTVLSTGIGTDNIDIVMNELDALVNINLEDRTVNEEKKQLNIIRLGTSGSLQADIPVDEFVVSTYGIGLDNLMNFYEKNISEKASNIIGNFIIQMHLQSSVLAPYIGEGSEELLEIFPNQFHRGITVTCSGFYAPQGRILRGNLSYPGLVNDLTNFEFEEHRITNFEMETSGIYGLCNILGHNGLSVNAIVANRVNKTYSKDAGKAIEKMITSVLDVVA